MSLSEDGQTAFVLFCGGEEKFESGHSTGETLFNHVALLRLLGDLSRLSGGGQEVSVIASMLKNLARMDSGRLSVFAQFCYPR